MTKKKGGKRMNKKQVAELLIDFFQNHPSETYSFKQIFKSLKMVTHPVKMLAIDVMEEMAWAWRGMAAKSVMAIAVAMAAASP